MWGCGGWPVGAWWWLVVGLWRWGCRFGIMEVGYRAVGLRLWKCGCGFGIVEVGH